MTVSEKASQITINKAQLLQTAKQVITTEQQAVANLLDCINNDFIKACELLIQCQGRIIVTGIGKSGYIANKIAASFASLGSPAFFLHAAEAMHGDIGIITKQDIIIALSYSGTSNEILALIPSLKYLDIPIIAITGDGNSPLAKAAHIHLPINIDQEACHLNLAPTASTTATLALGDALVVAVTKAKQITPQDFARSHPGGSLGRRLLLTVADIMVTKDQMPAVTPDTSLADSLLIMSSKGLGMIAVINQDNQILGVFTDGDLRRFLNNTDYSAKNLSEITIKTIINPNYTSVSEETLAVTAWELMSAKKINGLLITDSNNNLKLIGMLNIHNLINAKVI